MKSLPAFVALVVNNSADRNDKSVNARKVHNMKIICFAKESPTIFAVIQPTYTAFVTLCDADAVFLM